MSDVKYPKGKIFFLIALLIAYVIFGIMIKLLVLNGFITPQIPLVDRSENKFLIENAFINNAIAKELFNNNFVMENGHINLVYPLEGTSSQIEYNNTNSEAASYYLFWNALDRNKNAFDLELDYIRENMIHPSQGYLMWRLNPQDIAVSDGSNIASDADLRAIHALLIADKNWREPEYQETANSLAKSLEEIAITSDNLLAPYGGVANGEIWKTEEVWLSYADFRVFRELAEIRGEPWREVYFNMKSSVLDAQLDNGLYLTQLSENRTYHNTLDNDEHSINSLWVMVRAAESKDPELRESARRALDFYKLSYFQNEIIHTSYASDGTPTSQTDSPWTYALVARTAIELGDIEFAEKMISKLLEFQETSPESEIYGAFPEGSPHGNIVSQFTMQESIITLEEYNSLARSLSK